MQSYRIGFMTLKNLRSLALGTMILASSTVAILGGNSFKPGFAQGVGTFGANRNLIAQSRNVDIAALENSIFTQINRHRATKRLPALTRDSRIDSESRKHSQNMASGKTRFSHDGLAQRIQTTKIPWRGYAENVAYNKGHSDPAAVAVKGWLNSPGHRRNIDGQYNLTGIGVAVNSKGEIYFTQIFMQRR